MTTEKPVHVRLDGGDPERTYGRFVVSWLLPVLTAILSTTLCLSVSHANAQRGRAARADLQRTVCAIVVAQDDNYRASPPTTGAGKRNAVSMSQLRVTLGCEPRQP